MSQRVFSAVPATRSSLALVAPAQSGLMEMGSENVVGAMASPNLRSAVAGLPSSVKAGQVLQEQLRS